MSLIRLRSRIFAWMQLTERLLNLELLQLIARSYFEYDFINRLLDMAINSQRFDIVKNNITPLVNGEITRSEELLKNIINTLN